MRNIGLAIALIGIVCVFGCQSNQPPVARKPACDGEQCKRQTTPEQVLRKKPLATWEQSY